MRAPASFAQEGLEGVRELRDLLVADAVEIGALALGVYGHLKGSAGGVGAEDGEAVVLVDEAGAGADFLAPDVLEDRALLALVEIARDLELGDERRRKNGEGDELADGMWDVSAGLLANVLDDEEGAHAAIPHEIEHADFPGGDDIANRGEGERLQRLGAGGLDDDLMSTDALGAVVETIGMAKGIPLDAESGGAIGDYANLPGTTGGLAVKGVRGEVLVAGGEWAELFRGGRAPG